jgi:hypothetical protein
MGPLPDDIVPQDDIENKRYKWKYYDENVVFQLLSLHFSDVIDMNRCFVSEKGDNDR